MENREIIELTEFEIAPILYEDACEDSCYDEYYDDKFEIIGNPVWSQFIQIEEDITYSELGKGYQEINVIVQRLSDKKYFKGGYLKSYYDNNQYDSELIEVFPEEKTIIIFK